MVNPDVATLLDETWLTADMKPAARLRLATLGALAEIPAGTTIVREGEPCLTLAAVINGRVALHMRVPGGADRTILTVQSGDVVGWSAVLAQPIATSTAVALVPTTAVEFDGGALRLAMASDCELAAAVLERLLVSVSRRLVATRVQLLDLYRAGSEPW